MSLPHFCPSCGFNFEADKPLSVGPWIVSLGSVTYAGEAIRLTPSERGALYAIAAGKGRPVRGEAIHSRISDCADTTIARVTVSNIRRKLGDLCPIVTVWGTGYRWAAPIIEQPAGSLHGPEAAGSSTLPAASDLRLAHPSINTTIAGDNHA